ncbi:MAG: ferrochelatase [Planctomycetes bacterium]|nr:ferrochelatase [Planctomycetota bacterium]
MNSGAGKYDAILVVSFGGPEDPDDVIPFLENVLRGRRVPRERMLEVAEHYQQFGGISPINQQCRDLIAALQSELTEHGPPLPIYWGNRNWHPLLTDTLQKMSSDGIQNALAFVTSAFSSYSGCRQYREDIAQAQHAAGDHAPHVDKLRVFYNHPDFIDSMQDRLRAAMEKIPPERHDSTLLIFTGHSIPLSMAEGCAYRSQINEASRLVAEAFPNQPWRLAYQSRSGPPTQAWLEPDIGDELLRIGDKTKSSDVVVVPIGFISDHMEVIFDLDTEAQAICKRIGLNMVRAETAGTHPLFIRMIRELILERTEGCEPKSLGECGSGHNECPDDCCPIQLATN